MSDKETDNTLTMLLFIVTRYPFASFFAVLTAAFFALFRSLADYFLIAAIFTIFIFLFGLFIKMLRADLLRLASYFSKNRDIN